MYYPLQHIHSHMTLDNLLRFLDALGVEIEPYHPNAWIDFMERHAPLRAHVSFV